MDYFYILVHQFKTNKVIKDIYTDDRSFLLPLTGAVSGGVLAGPVGAVIGAIGGVVLAGQSKQEVNKEYDSTIAMLDCLDYDEKHHLVGIVQGTLGSCELSELTKCLNNRQGANKVIRAVKMFKEFIKWEH